MSEQQAQHPIDELKGLFEEAAKQARKAWDLARERSEATKQQNEIYRELVSMGSAAVDVLERAVKKAWKDSAPQ